MRLAKPAAVMTLVIDTAPRSRIRGFDFLHGQFQVPIVLDAGFVQSLLEECHQLLPGYVEGHHDQRNAVCLTQFAFTRSFSCNFSNRLSSCGMDE